MVVSSTATRPARAPASMAMLHTVMRPSMLGTDGAAGEFDGVAGAAGGADAADDGQHDVLGREPGGSVAVDPDQHVLGLLGQQGLRGQHVLDLAGADAVGQRAEGAVRAGVAVAADHRHAGQRGALLRADDVHDALALVEGTESTPPRRTAGCWRPAW
jgi:hypothetical protein